MTSYGCDARCQEDEVDNARKRKRDTRHKQEANVLMKMSGMLNICTISYWMNMVRNVMCLDFDFGYGAFLLKNTLVMTIHMTSLHLKSPSQKAERITV